MSSAAGKFAQRSVSIGTQQNGMIAITAGLKKAKACWDGSVFIQFATSINKAHTMIAKLVSFALRQPFLIVVGASP